MITSYVMRARDITDVRTMNRLIGALARLYLHRKEPEPTVDMLCWHYLPPRLYWCIILCKTSYFRHPLLPCPTGGLFRGDGNQTVALIATMCVCVRVCVIFIQFFGQVCLNGLLVWWDVVCPRQKRWGVWTMGCVGHDGWQQLDTLRDCVIRTITTHPHFVENQQ